MLPVAGREVRRRSVSSRAGLIESGRIFASKRASTSCTKGSLAECRLGPRLLLGPLALLLRGERSFGGRAHLEREHQLASGGLVERRLELVGIGLVGEVLCVAGKASVSDVARRAI